MLERGTSFGAPTDLEVELARKVIEAVPSIEMVRMVNSGTEATMSAIRLARGYTGRDKIVKFEGCYHGHADSLLVKAGSGALTPSESRITWWMYRGSLLMIALAAPRRDWACSTPLPPDGCTYTDTETKPSRPLPLTVLPSGL